MAKLIIRGKSEPVDCSAEQAEVIAGMLQDNPQADAVCQAGNITVRLREVKQVIEDSPKTPNLADKQFEQWKTEADAFRRLTPQEKADKVLRGYAQLVLACVGSPAYLKNGTIEPTVAAQIRQAVIGWYQDSRNRWRLYPEWHLFMEHLPANWAKGRTASRYYVRAVGIMANALAQDREFTNKRLGVVMPAAQPAGKTRLPF